MPWMNFHHLLYFYTVAREGSVLRAARTLHLTQPTVSAQLRQLERALGAPLFERRHRRLVLTDAGHVAFHYAESIFALGRELQAAIGGQATGRPARLAIGLTDAVPKLIAFRLMAPLQAMPVPPMLTCRDDTPDRLLIALAAHDLDLVITDAPPSPATPVRVFSHVLGSSGITIFGTPELARKYRRRFPRSLEGAPFLLPTEQAALRRHLDQWFAREAVRPDVRGQFADSALLKTFGQAGVGLFAAPTSIASEVRRQYGVHVVGQLDSVHEEFYAITAERTITHPAVVLITEHAQSRVFR